MMRCIAEGLPLRATLWGAPRPRAARQTGSPWQRTCDRENDSLGAKAISSFVCTQLELTLEASVSMVSALCYAGEHVERGRKGKL